MAVSGNRNKPFVVPVKQQIAGDLPALPGQSPPKQCAESAGEECPPDFPGCHNPKKEDGEECASGDECKSGACTDGKCVSKKAAGEECENDSDCQSGSCADGKCAEGTTEQKKKGPGEDCEENAECESNVCKDAKCEGGGKSKFPHIWIGVAGSIDAFIMQSANDACHLNAQGTAPLSGNYYCTDPNSGSNVPGAVASPPDWNNAIILGKSDQVSGGLALGNIRIMLSFDYAITQNILVGLRGGYVALTYPGGSPGAPFGPFHIEVRATYLVGKDALTKPFAPMIYVAGGVGEFDAKVGVTTILNPNCTQGDMLCSGTVNNKNGIPSGATQENAWLTAGPGFFKVGGGIHAFFAKKFAYTAGLGFVGALGGTAGFLPGIELEPIGFQVGF